MRISQLTFNTLIFNQKLITQLLMVGCICVSVLYSKSSYAVDNRFSIVCNPKIRLQGDLDYSNLDSLVNGLFQKYNSTTPREKAETIWRFLLTSKEFGGQAIYHLSGWAYEEPDGEVLDPLKLLNVYGYGLCYQIAPLGEALYDAAGFSDARVWFLTGHTISEVFYEGAYHYFDSDLMGYSVKSENHYPQNGVVAGLQDIIQDTTIITDKLLSPKKINTSLVDFPWYPYDVEIGAMNHILRLLTTRDDNWLYYDRRYSSGHSMHFVCRKGEKLVRYFGNDGNFYLPYKKVKNLFLEFPKDVPRYDIWVKNGPYALRDDRTWGTGKLVYSPDLTDMRAFYQPFSKIFNNNFSLASDDHFPKHLQAVKPDEKLVMTFKMQCPFVFINSVITGEISVKINPDRLKIFYSTDWGKTWSGSQVTFLNDGLMFKACPKPIVESQHGQLTPISGKYNYLVRIEILPNREYDKVGVHNILIKSMIQHNPRTLPGLTTGENKLIVTYGDQVELQSLRPDISRIGQFADKIDNVKYVCDENQGFLVPENNQKGTIIFKIKAPDDGIIKRIQVGGRFLKCTDIAPDKYTSEIRNTDCGFNYENDIYKASISTLEDDSLTFQNIWQFDKKIIWKNNRPVKKYLRWPEVDKTINFKSSVKTCFVKYNMQNLALDKIRINVFYQHSQPIEISKNVIITHTWQEDGLEKTFTETPSPETGNHSYTIGLLGNKIINKSLTIEVK